MVKFQRREKNGEARRPGACYIFYLHLALHFPMISTAVLPSGLFIFDYQAKSVKSPE